MDEREQLIEIGADGIKAAGDCTNPGVHYCDECSCRFWAAAVIDALTEADAFANADRVAEAERERDTWKAAFDEATAVGTETSATLEAALVRIRQLQARLSETNEERARVAELTEALRDARAELATWGWGDMHYSTEIKQEASVVAALAKIDGVLGLR